MAVIREDEWGDFDACPMNPSKNSYKSNINIHLPIIIKLMKVETK
jgi:hypothetical protein